MVGTSNLGSWNGHWWCVQLAISEVGLREEMEKCEDLPSCTQAGLLWFLDQEFPASHGMLWKIPMEHGPFNPYPLLINGPPPSPPNNKIRNFGNAFFLLGGCFRVALSVVINYVAWWLILFEFAGVLMMKLPRYHIMFGHVCLALAWSTTASITTTLASTITTLAIAAQRIIYFFSRSTTMATTLTKSLHAPKPSHAKPERLWRWSQLKLWFHHWHNADYTTTILVTMITTAMTPLRCSILPLQTNFVVCIIGQGTKASVEGGQRSQE